VIFFIYHSSYWLSDTQDAVAVKDRLSQFVNQLVLLLDDTFLEVIKNTFQVFIINKIIVKKPNKKLNFKFINNYEF